MCAESGSTVQTMLFPYEVTKENLASATRDAKEFEAEVVIAIGGGKTLDLSKGVAMNLDLPYIIIPTAASTDAPTSSLSVIYNDDGVHVSEDFYDRSPNMVLVDSQIIADAPVRFLVSGMGDALATYFEARANEAEDAANFVNVNDGGYRRTLASMAIARTCYDTLIEKGVHAKLAAEAGVVTPALEDIIEANILLSGLGFENTGIAGGHAVNDGVTALPAGSKTLHGEKVAFGTIAQLVIENAPKDEIEDVILFCLSVGLPVCLEDLFVENTDENIKVIADSSMHSCWDHEPIHVTAEMVFNAVRVADSLGRMYKDACS